MLRKLTKQTCRQIKYQGQFVTSCVIHSDVVFLMVRTCSEVCDKGKEKEKWSETQVGYDDNCVGEDAAK